MRQFNFILALVCALFAQLAAAQAVRTYEGKHVGTLGTNSLPSFTFLNDLDTGLYHPAANTVAITTNSVARLTVDDAYTFILGANSGNLTTSGLAIGTGGSSQIEPTIVGVGSGAGNIDLRLIGRSPTADDSTAAATVILRGSRTDGTALTTRDVLHVQNAGTDLFNISAAGNINVSGAVVQVASSGATSIAHILARGGSESARIAVAGSNGAGGVSASLQDDLLLRSSGHQILMSTDTGTTVAFGIGTNGAASIGIPTLSTSNQVNGFIRLGQTGLAANYSGTVRVASNGGGTADFDGIIASSDAFVFINCAKNGGDSGAIYYKRSSTLTLLTGTMVGSVTPTVVTGANAGSAIRLSNADATFSASCTVSMLGAF